MEDLQHVYSQKNNADNVLINILMSTVSKIDMEMINERVKALKMEFPKTRHVDIVQKLVRKKCRQAATIGAVTSGTGLVPGVGTAVAVMLGGMADMAATLRLQSELVLEIASVYGYSMADDEKYKLIFLVTGIASDHSVKANISINFAGKSIVKVLPLFGMIASASGNVLSTYIVGQRADMYFRFGAEAVGSWNDSVRTITGVDERLIGKWLVESGKQTGISILWGTGKMIRLGGLLGKAMIGRAVRWIQT